MSKIHPLYLILGAFTLFFFACLGLAHLYITYGPTDSFKGVIYDKYSGHIMETGKPVWVLRPKLKMCAQCDYDFLVELHVTPEVYNQFNLEDTVTVTYLAGGSNFKSISK